MYKKLLIYCLFIFLFSAVKAQNEFITVWKPSTPQPTGPYIPLPYSSSSSQIWLPVNGTNFKIYWEEIGYPSHNATLLNVTSAYQVIVDFGTPMNSVPENATYRVKISNGSGVFNYIRFLDNDIYPIGNSTTTLGTVGDHLKIQKVEQWGNIAWTSMMQAFEGCQNLDITATDTPDLSHTTTLSSTFARCNMLVFNPSINNWNISGITDISGMFKGCYAFNQPLGNWDTSNVTNMNSIFFNAWAFNQPLATWNTSSAETMANMFAYTRTFNQSVENWNVANVTSSSGMFQHAWAFNQPIGNWNVTNITTMNSMFSSAVAFNQDITNWNTHNVNDMQGMFSYAFSFNQNIGNWDTSNVENMALMFNNATSFNQSLGKWNLNSVTLAQNMLANSGLNCRNYDDTLLGWSNNPNTPYTINLLSTAPLSYSNSLAVSARNNLLMNKGWSISGDIYNPECESFLATSENILKNDIRIYPNPASDFIYIKNASGIQSYQISDVSGRIIIQNSLSEEKINIRSLPKGNYILKVASKRNMQSFKFIKE